MMKTINERLADFVEEIGESTHNGKGIPEVARRAGLDPNTLRAILRPNGSKPSADSIQAILSAYPHLSSEWLMRGTGPMVRATKGISKDEVAQAELMDAIGDIAEGRNLTPVPTDPAPQQPTAAAVGKVGAEGPTALHLQTKLIEYLERELAASQQREDYFREKFEELLGKPWGNYHAAMDTPLRVA